MSAHRRRARILLADDHAPTREDIRYALERENQFEVVAEAADAPGAIDQALRERPDLVLLDIRMPGGGVSAAWEIHSRLPRARIVMLTASDEDADLFGALRAGAVGYLLKDIDPRTLPAELDAALAGETVLSRRLIGRVVEEFRDRSARRRSTELEGREAQLTSREWQVLDMLRQGLNPPQIAERLVLSPVTVRTHVQSILRKLEYSSREELLREFGGER